MKSITLFGTAFLCLTLTFCSMAVAATFPVQQEAERILSTTGIKGGLIVHIGCGDGKLTAALHANSRYLVHGLDKHIEKIERARKYIQSLGLYGVVSVEQWKDGYLPYADNLVNLLVSQQPPDVTIDELMRVLAPNGVAYIKRGQTG